MLRTNLLLLGVILAAPRLGIAADRELDRLRALRIDEFEKQAKAHIENVETGLAPLMRAVEIHALAEARAASRQFRNRAYQSVRNLLDGPDFSDRITLREAVELWRANGRNVYARRVRGPTSRVAR